MLISFVGAKVMIFERFAKNICAFITNDYAND